MNRSDERPTDDAEVQALRDLLRRDDVEPSLPPWFSARLMHEVRRSRRWGRWQLIWPDVLQTLLGVRVALPVLTAAALAGAWMGYQEASGSALHLAEVRYLDEIDPVHLHR